MRPTLGDVGCVVGAVVGAAVVVAAYAGLFWTSNRLPEPWAAIAVLVLLVIAAVRSGRRHRRTRGPRNALESELNRVGLEDETYVHVHGDLSASISELAPPEREWQGSADEALRRLSGIADGAGPTEFWELFPERPSEWKPVDGTTD